VRDVNLRLPRRHNLARRTGGRRRRLAKGIAVNSHAPARQYKHGGDNGRPKAIGRGFIGDAH
jgi:hypothetical protein